MGKRSRITKSSPESSKEKIPRIIIRDQKLVDEILQISGGDRYKTRVISEAIVRLGLQKLKETPDVCVALGVATYDVGADQTGDTKDEDGFDLSGLVGIDSGSIV